MNSFNVFILCAYCFGFIHVSIDFGCFYCERFLLPTRILIKEIVHTCSCIDGGSHVQKCTSVKLDAKGLCPGSVAGYDEGGGPSKEALSQ